MLNPIHVVDKQNTIIKIQSEIIDELFMLLMQHISVDEADTLTVVNKINIAANLGREI
jgi:hypothetical protein